MSARAGNTIGQDRSDLVQRKATVHAIWEQVTIDALSTRALHQVSDVEVETVSVIVCHDY